MSPIGPYQAVLLALIALAIYLIPAAVALSRGHRQLGPIVALNLVLGWTGLGWIAALVWGLRGPAAFSASPPADANATRRERIAGFTKQHAWRPVSNPDAAPEGSWQPARGEGKTGNTR